MNARTPEPAPRKVPVRFVGVDLAWGDRKPSAAVVLEARQDEPARPVAFSSGMESIEEIGDFILGHTPGAALIGIDAPLVVPNVNGARPCDAACTAKWGRYDAGALPANKKQCGDPSRGWRLFEHLAGAVFEHRYDIEPGRPVRTVLEVYPNPAAVALFGLERIFKYKRSATAQNQEGLAAFQKKIVAELDQIDPPVELGEELGGRLMRNPARLKGIEFERQSDLVDALMCATIVFHHWHWGTKKWEVLGSMEEGSILVPRAEAYGLEAP